MSISEVTLNDVVPRKMLEIIHLGCNRDIKVDPINGWRVKVMKSLLSTSKIG